MNHSNYRKLLSIEVSRESLIFVFCYTLLSVAISHVFYSHSLPIFRSFFQYYCFFFSRIALPTFNSIFSWLCPQTSIFHLDICCLLHSISISIQFHIVVLSGGKFLGLTDTEGRGGGRLV